MKLSVIIPCLERNALVERAIASIGPAVPQLETELVVIEGERPLGRSRNVGLARATGDYVAWIDGDDEVSPRWLASIAGALTAHPGVDLVVLGMEHVGWPGRRDTVWIAPEGPGDPDRLLLDLYHDLGFAGNQVLLVSRRALWDGLAFDEDVTVGEDYLMAPRLVAKARSCCNLREPLYRYRFTPGSLMAAPDPAKERDRILILERRLATAPRRFRRAAAWGAGVECYWWADAAACTRVETGLAGYGRRWIRRHFAALAAEAVFGRVLPLADRVGWLARFACAALGWWTLQRRRSLRKGARK